MVELLIQPLAIVPLLADAMFAGVLDLASFSHCDDPLRQPLGNPYIALTLIMGATFARQSGPAPDLRPCLAALQ